MNRKMWFSRNMVIKYFVGTIFFLLLTFSISFAYFIVFIASSPRSIPFITNHLRSSLEETFGPNNSGIQDSIISINKHFAFEVDVVGLNLSLSQFGKKNEFVSIPRLELEFSLLDLIFLRLYPSKIKINDINLLFNVGDKDDLDNNQKAPISSQDRLHNLQQQISMLLENLESLNQLSESTKKYEINNATILLKGNEVETKFFVKNSQIKITRGLEVFELDMKNQVKIDDSNFLKIDSRCFILPGKSAKCQIGSKNIEYSVIQKFLPKNSLLEGANIPLNLALDLEIKDYALHNVGLKIFSKEGYLMPSKTSDEMRIFNKKLTYQNLVVEGRYRIDSGQMKITEASADIIDCKNDQDCNDKNENIHRFKIHSALNLSDLYKSNWNIRLFIGVKDAKIDSLDKFWPLFLDENGVRDWVTTNIKGGKVDSAYVTMLINFNDKASKLANLGSQINFSETSVSYDKNLPTITNASGVAYFDQDSMKIKIASAQGLSHKISNAQVSIEDFSQNIVNLKILGNFSGKAYEGFNFAFSDKSFLKEMKKWLNCDAEGKFELSLPIKENFDSKDILLKIDSKLTNINNQNVSGTSSLALDKKFGDKDFLINLVLSDAKISIPQLKITKDKGIDANLAFAVNAQGNFVNIDKIILTTRKNKDITGNISINTALKNPLSELKFKSNLYHNNYSISYKKNANEKIMLQLSGSRFDLGNFLKDKEFLNSLNGGNDKLHNLFVSVNIGRIDLVGDKYINNVHADLNYLDGLFSKLSLRASYRGGAITNIANKMADLKSSIIIGRVDNIGYLLEGFGLSNIIAGGNLKFRLDNKRTDSKDLFVLGELRVEDGITIFESEEVKKLAKDTFFSRLKDKIFSSDKTEFTYIKSEFELNSYKLNIKSLVANNYKIGVTSKGSINLDSGACELTGMIIPGFIINNLFGVGNIPVLGKVFNLLTDGEGGGVFGLKYHYSKNDKNSQAEFTTNKISSFIPATLQNLFD